jgi:hypothetical protein
MMRFVELGEGAIGYVPADYVKTSKVRVKVLSVDGLMPDDNRYRIK